MNLLYITYDLSKNTRYFSGDSVVKSLISLEKKMTREIITNIQSNRVSSVSAYRTKKLVQFFRAIALFSMPIRCSELGLRRRR